MPYVHAAFHVAFTMFLARAPLIAQRPVVCIDPGHPSETAAGDVVQHGTTEVHVAWRVAQRLQILLERSGYRVCITKRAERQYVTNRERAGRANHAGAQLLVRLHCDAGAIRGFAVYYPDRTGTVAGVTGPSVDVRMRSRAAAESLHAGMAAALGDALSDRGVLTDSQTLVGSRQGALTGSIFSQVPVVLIEMVVLSDSSDAAFIKGDGGAERMARAIAAGVQRYVPIAPLKEP